MKKLWIGLLILLMTGCAAQQGEMDQALKLRSRILSEACTFTVRITADYIDSRETFTVACSHDPQKGLSFQITEPEEIAGICGSVDGREGTLSFDGAVLALPLVADERISPVSGPWVMLKALGSGNLLSCASQDDALCITVRDSYEDDALEAEIWAEEGKLTSAEISWRGRRNLTMEIEDFSFVQKTQEAA